MSNLEKKIEWAIIIGECEWFGNKKGTAIAISRYQHYDILVWQEILASSFYKTKILRNKEN